MIGVTGATGQLGRLVFESLLEKVPANQLVACVRDPAKAQDLAGRGVTVRRCDYDQAETLGPAFEGVTKLLLISASEVGRRAAQHQAVIDAAKSASVELIAYTSLLHADRSPIGLANEHRATEEALRESGVPFVVLRNGWYTENYTMAIPAAIQNGALFGCAGDGRISSAARKDYAEAAAAVITSDEQAGRVYELAGDEAYTLSQLAEEVSRQSGKQIGYRNLTEEAYRTSLVNVGLPEPVAAMLANADAAVAQNALFNDSRELSRLIGRPTTPLSEMVAAVLKR